MLPDERLQSIEVTLAEIKELLHRMLFKQCQENDEADVTYLNVKDAAKLLGVQPSLIYAKCNNGNLPHVRVGKYYKFRKDELLQWVNEPKPVDVNIDDYVNRYLQKNVLKG